MVAALITHGHSWNVPTCRANNSCHVAHAAPVLADTVWQSHSLSLLASAHAKRNTHARLRSPCVFPSANSDEQRGDLGLCQTHDASAAIKPVPWRPKRGYASHPLAERASVFRYSMVLFRFILEVLTNKNPASVGYVSILYLLYIPLLRWGRYLSLDQPCLPCLPGLMNDAWAHAT